MVAVGSARSAAVVTRLGTWTLLAGGALLAVGLAGVAGLLRWAGTGLHGYQLSPALIVAGLGAGFRICFHDRASQNDPTATPASCLRIQRQVAAFLLTGLLVLALPKVKPTTTVPGGA